MKMKIIDATILSRRDTGVARGIRQIIISRSGRKDYIMLVNKHFNIPGIYRKVMLPFSHIGPVRFIYQIFLMPFILAYFKAEWYVSPTHILPLFKYGKYLAVAHDMMLYRVKGKYPFFKSLLYHFYYLLTYSNADVLVTSSENSRNEIAAFSKKRVFIVRLKVQLDLDVNKPLYALLGKKFILTVGSLEKGKNIGLLVKAYALLPEALRREYELVITGKNVNSSDELTKLVRSAGIGNSTSFTGFVTDPELIWLYRNCSLFVFPSLYEGFGFPVIEALACGAKVIASDTSSIPEILRNPAYRFSPYVPEDLSSLMRRMLTDREFSSDYTRWLGEEKEFLKKYF